MNEEANPTLAALPDRRELSKAQKFVLTAAFVPMLGTGVAGGMGTFSNIKGSYGAGTALGAVAAGEGATAVLALVLLGLTMLDQAAPLVIRAGLWALPAAASVMAGTAAPDGGRTVIYAVTPMGMCVAAEGMAFLARRIVVHTDNRDAEAERKAAAVVQALAFHRARATNHPSGTVRWWSERLSWRLARKVGTGDATLGSRLLNVQRERVTAGADAALADMFTSKSTPTVPLDRNAAPSSREAPCGLSGEVAQLGHTSADRSTRELESSTLAPSAPVEATDAPAPRPVEPVEPVTVEPARPTAAAESARPRRATGRVPRAARSSRPTRTADELLDDARSATVDWPDTDLTAEGIRKAVHTSAEKARGLREALRAERIQAVTSDEEAAA